MTLLQPMSDKTALNDSVQETYERIEEAVVQQQCIHLQWAERNIYIRGDTRQFLCECPMPQLQTSAFHTGSVNLLDSAEDVMREVRERGRPLDELLWTLGWHRSGGELLEQCRRNDVVLFSRWPNLSRLPVSASTHRIVALFTARPSSVVLASRLLGVSEDEVAQVYSAGMTAGYAAPINRTIDPPVAKPHRHKSLIGRLIQHLQRD